MNQLNFAALLLLPLMQIAFAKIIVTNIKVYVYLCTLCLCMTCSCVFVLVCTTQSRQLETRFVSLILNALLTSCPAHTEGHSCEAVEALCLSLLCHLPLHF